jgi:hypothetical protein
MLQPEQRAVIRRAIQALDEALFKLQQKGKSRDDDWLEEIRLASLALEELLDAK